MELASRADWTAARLALLDDEKELTRRGGRRRGRAARAAVGARREGLRLRHADGPQTLAELFDGRSQLAIYHFMFGPDWTQGCHRCSFWADNFDGIAVHLAHRDTTFLAVSNTAVENIEAYRQRMGWEFKWVSSLGSDFNRDFNVSWTDEELKAGKGRYNFGTGWAFFTEMQGLSVFAKLDDGRVAHTYSTYARGIDVFNGAYQILDLTPKGATRTGSAPTRCAGFGATTSTRTER